MKHIDVVAAIIVKDERILATQRGYGEYAGQWEFPGGKIEQGEEPQVALKREIREELDADIEIHDHLITVSYDYDDFSLTMDCFVCSLEGTLTLLEHDDARWLSAKKIYSVDWLPADIEVVDAILEQDII